MEPNNYDEIKNLIEAQGKAFAEFKVANDLNIAELKKRGASDPVLEEKLARLSKGIDDALESKAALEKRIDAERKEREDLELRLSRRGDKNDRAADEVKEFNRVLAVGAAEKARPAPVFSVDEYAEYKNSFVKLLRKGVNVPSALEEKAMIASSDPQGGFFVPVDTAGRIVNRVFETSPIRQIASQVNVSVAEMSGIEDLNEAGAGYADEQDPPRDTSTPDIGKWRMAVHEIKAQPKISQQLLEDSVFDVEGWLANKVSDYISRFENREFVNGANRIRGFLSYATAADDGSGVAWQKIGYTVSGANGGFKSTGAADAIFDLIGLLKNRYLQNATFVTRRSVITELRKLKDAQGRYLWEPSLQKGQPEQLLGYPIMRAEDMPAIGNGSLSLSFGDFREGYQIMDRLGLTVIRDIYTEKPNVLFYTRKRCGGGVLNFEAIKHLKFSAS